MGLELGQQLSAAPHRAAEAWWCGGVPRQSSSANLAQQAACSDGEAVWRRSSVTWLGLGLGLGLGFGLGFGFGFGLGLANRAVRSEWLELPSHVPYY